MPSGTPIAARTVRPDTLSCMVEANRSSDQSVTGHAEADRRSEIPDQRMAEEPQVLNHERIVETHLGVEFAQAARGVIAPPSAPASISSAGSPGRTCMIMKTISEIRQRTGR